MNRTVTSRFFTACALSTLLMLNFVAPVQAFEMSASRPISIDFTETSASNASLKIELGDLVTIEELNQGERYDRFPIDGQPIAGPVGRPELPAIVKFILIPPQSGVSMRIKNLRSHLVRDVNPYPRQPEPLEKDISSVTEYEASRVNAPLVVDNEFYSENAFWPEEQVTLGEPQVMRGYRILPVRLNPLRYNPTTHEMEVIDAVELEFDFSSDENRFNLVQNPGKLRPSLNVDRLLQQIVVNPPSPNRDLGTRGGSILYVLGTGNAWNPILAELLPLIEWRRKMGWTVDVLRVNNPGDANTVRTAIQDYYDDAENPPEHVIICGDADAQGRNFVIGFFNKKLNGGYAYESDHDFGCLEGEDVLPEASVGRFIFNTTAMLRDIVTKTILYESDPYLGEGDFAGWQTRGAVEATTSLSGLSSVDMCRWSKAEMLNNGFSRVNELYYQQINVEENNRQFVMDNFAAGMSIFIHRGHLWMGQGNGKFLWDDVSQLRNARMLPFAMIITCNTGDYSEVTSSQYYFNERFSFQPAGGAIGATGCSGATHTAYNNIYCTETVRAFVTEGITNQGWAHESGKLALYSHYADRGDVPHEENPQMEAWLCELYITNLMGDPAVDLFTAVPRRLAVTSPAAIRSGESRVEVTVLYDDNDQPAYDADVCLYKSEAFQIVKRPDADGRVVFDLDPSWTEEDSVHLTITGHNLLTSRRSYLVNEDVQHFFGASAFTIDDDNNGNSVGNDDSETNQLETIELTIDVKNTGTSDMQGQVDLHLTTDHPHLEVLEEGRTSLEQPPAVGESSPATFLVRIGGGFPSGQSASFKLETTIGDESWISSVALPVSGPDVEFVSLAWDGDPLHRAENAQFDALLRNVGTAGIPAFTARLFSLSRTVGPVEAEANFRALDVDAAAESGSPYRVSAHPFHIGHKPVKMGFVITAENGIVDTAYFDLPISEPVAGEPFGPDDYGYICFDNTDETWFAYPEFNWVEIDPRRGGNGTNTNLRDGSQSDDHSVTVDLPFIYQYYGQEFEQLTICSNGWVAPGDYDQLNSARNRHIPGGECPPGMIAPFWEDMVIPQNAGVFTWFDEENHRFIVEWSGLRKLDRLGQNDPFETFQVILHDPDFFPSFTGDGDIVFQYLDIEDNQNADGTWDTPFASIGIASPDVSTGLEYSYWNERPGGAAPIRDSLAIKFTTLVEFVTGSLSGRVYDAADGSPLDSAIVYTTYGFSAITDENGEFSILDMLVDSVYEFTATKEFYNDSTIAGEIRENEETYVEFGLLHPEFSLSDDSSNYIMLTDSIAVGALTLRNTGNGEMTFSSRYGYEIEHVQEPDPADNGDLPRDDPDDAWELLRQWPLADTLDNPRIQAVAYIRDHWLIAASRIGQEGPGIFYTLDREGSLTSQFPQPDSIGGTFGFRDLEYENGNLWAAAADNCLYQLDPEAGTIIHKWWGINRLDAIRCVTRDPATGQFYLSATTGMVSIVELVDDTLMVAVQQFNPLDPRDNQAIRKYGFAWMPDDPEGYTLYIIGTNEVPANSADHQDLAIFKTKPATGESIFITDLSEYVTPSSGGKCGMTITYNWSNRVYALAAIIENAAHDWLGIFEIAPNTSWVSYEPKSGTLQAGEQTMIDIEVASTNLDTGLYQIMIDFTHNAAPGFQRLPVEMHVVDTLHSAADDNQLLPKGFHLQAAYPNPFNETTTIRFSLEVAGLTRLKVFDLQGREVAALYDQPMKPGQYATSFRSKGLASGVYICRLESGGKTAVRKMVLMK